MKKNASIDNYVSKVNYGNVYSCLGNLYSRNRYRFNEPIKHYINAGAYSIFLSKRKEYIMTELKKIENCFQQLHFVPCITPDDIDEEEVAILSSCYVYDSEIYQKITNLAVGLSFALCFMDAIDRGYDYFILFEDDVKIDCTQTQLTACISDFVRSDFDIMYMGYCWMDCNQDFKRSGFGSLYAIPDNRALCSHAIVLKIDTMKEFINYCFPMLRACDNLMVDFIQTYNKKACVPKKVLFRQNRECLGSENGNNDYLPPECQL